MDISFYNLVLLLLFLLIIVHWVATLALCIQKQKSNKVFWLLIIFFTCPIGQFYYRYKNDLPVFGF